MGFSTELHDFQKVSHDCRLTNGKHIRTEILGKWKISNAVDYCKKVYSVERANKMFLESNGVAFCKIFESIPVVNRSDQFEKNVIKHLNEFYKT